MLQNNRKTHSGVSEPDAGEGHMLKVVFATWIVLDLLPPEIFSTMAELKMKSGIFFQTGLEMKNKTFVSKYQTDLFEFQRI